MADIHVTEGESWLAQREDHASLLAKVQSLVVNAYAYLSARKLSDSDIEDLTRTLSYNDVFKSVADALHAYGFPGFVRRKQKPSPPNPKVAEQLQDYAAIYVVNAGTELAERIRADGAAMIHTDTAADYARTYSEIVLCRMMFGLPEMKAATLQKQQQDFASRERPSQLNVAIRLILEKYGCDTSAKEVEQLLPTLLKGNSGMKDRVSRERKKLRPQ